MLTQKCISKIVVDKEPRTACFYVRCVPAITPALEEGKSRNNEEYGMNILRARNPQYALVTTSHLLFELSLGVRQQRCGFAHT